MKRKAAFLLGAAAGAFVLDGAARASETIVYSYDPLGRLTGASTTGGPNDGLGVATGYDPAGNRTNYGVGTDGNPPPTPTPTPTPSNQPPVTVSDSLSVPQCSAGTRDVLANDSDPEGNVPLSLVSLAQGSKGTATISNSTTIRYEADVVTGTDKVTYTVRDSLGATSTGNLNITITSGTCN